MGNIEKPDLSKLRVEVRHYTDMWQAIKDATMTTIGKDSGKYPDEVWKRKLLMAEHSPIRAGYFLVKIYNAPQFVHGHLVRHHIGATPFISTLRPDRTDYDKVPDRNTLQDGEYLFNFQSIINISRKRLCNCASYETRYVWLNVLEEIKTYEPELVKMCRRECVYRGFCPEMFQCKQKYTETKAFQKELAEYRGTICRNN